MTTAPPSPSTSSPPAKRLKSSVAKPDVITTDSFPEINEAPIKSEFLPGTNGHATVIPKGDGPSTSNTASSSKPQPVQVQGKKKKNRKIKRTLPEKYSSADVIFHDVRDFLGQKVVDEILDKNDGSEWEAPEGLDLYKEVVLDVGAFTVSGESISTYPNPSNKPWAIITPFAHPGDKIRVKIFKHDRLSSHADLLEILEYSEEYRGGEGDRRKYPEGGCKYFGECGGCQLQPVPYPLQLLHKKRTVELAYQRFSNLPSSVLPTIQPTIGSPKQWQYRTKITPHFDAPPKWFQRQLKERATASATTEEGQMNAEDGHEQERGWETRIGFERKGKPGVLDIEECPIATPVLNKKLTEERKRVQDTILSFTRGATILLRDSLPTPSPIPTAESPYVPSSSASTEEEEEHIAITNHKFDVYEKVGKYLFSFSAGSFFQNNNSILIPLTEYVKEAIFPSSEDYTGKLPTHLVDTYCGSGLFGITLSDRFERVAGVEISDQSIIAAKKNAEINGLGDKTTWLCGKAEDIFGGLGEKGFEGGKSCVVVDPPRKGCDEPFLTQLLVFKPLTIVYVSCNVHTQARDVGYLIRESANWVGKKYVVESLRGFDLFPQTAHVESVAVLRLVES
ncbi:tRNA (uracil-5-)-methyltransferase [Kwoniella mangroviensis CBS 10435]|uniref:tRNA (Uracil-5-)-methyltransferase n=1 Tax=Kwoniella mangroviensis CBS 10435 TaxID=1331196 RepID=A0A1B9IEK4_9TREE|nr:tRNA (uracil-5-)-methyltransferase [Kwoniella mangroviensis CBS 10435]